MEPYSEAALFALFAVVLGVVIFGGTTLAYFLGKHGPGSRSQVHEETSLRAGGAASAAGLAQLSGYT